MLKDADVKQSPKVEKIGVKSLIPLMGREPKVWAYSNESGEIVCMAWSKRACQVAALAIIAAGA